MTETAQTTSSNENTAAAPVKGSHIKDKGVTAAKPQAKGQAPKTEAHRGEGKKTYSRAILKRTFLLGSDEAQSIMARHGEKMKTACFQIGKIIHITIDQKKAAEFEALKQSGLDEIGKEYDKEQARLEALFEANAVLDPVGYSQPQEYELEVDSQGFMKVIELLIKLDRVISYYDTLNMLTIMKEPDCRIQKSHLRARLMNFCGRTIAEVDKIRKFANMPEAESNLGPKGEKQEAAKQADVKVIKNQSTVTEPGPELELIA